jgi:DNA-binding transcriptional LysR family regulator
VVSTSVDLKRLALFRQVVESGGLSAAETVLNVNLPTISAHLASLEASLGMRLCERGRRGFRLTEQGQGVLAASERLFESVQAFRAELDAVSGKVAGSLRLGLADNTIGDPASPVPQALRSLRERARGLELTLDVRNPFELERALRDERLDVVVGPFNSTDPDFEHLPLYAERLSLYVGRGHRLFGRPRITLQELAGADCVMRGYLRESQAASPPVSFHYSATAHNLEGVAQLVLTGDYLGYLPDHYAAGWVRSRRMRAVLPERTGYDVAFKALAHKRPRRGGATAVFLELLRGAAGDGRKGAA